MIIKSAKFICSNSNPHLCPKTNLPEFAFIGRSNVGKSSLINMLVDRKKLAKTSSTPGKTQLINHFLINEEWYLVDLPGYGYAKISKTTRMKILEMINIYIYKRINLYCIFVLIDCRHEPMVSDLDMINQLGRNRIPLALIFTKTDKLNKSNLNKNVGKYKKAVLKSWHEVPPVFITSSIKKQGREEILDFIEHSINKSI
ncbi:MAG: YihA family ribosome biogenesis GTP-binding protein [Bacteroidales bacterium]|nr:YihA family ribosome biogenesis GTP-binding protein [Bacteroidales bacterium]